MSFHSSLIDQQITVMQKELSALRKELHDTQKEMSQVLGELQNTIRSLAAMTSAGINGLDARVTQLEPQKTDHDTPRSGVEL